MKGEFTIEYFLERNGLRPKDFKVSYNKLKEYFIETYLYFLRKGDFNSAFYGVYIGENQKEPPTMSPSPEIYILKNLYKGSIFPIEDYYQKYDSDTLFTVIEILHNHIAKYDIKYLEYIIDEPREEFRKHINSLLKFYNEGYYINEQGYILELPNDALLNVISRAPNEIESQLILEKYRSAIKMYLHYTSNREEKRKAINLLADILEPLRNELKNILNEEWEFNKNLHDNLIFEIVNNFNIRHNKEVKNYSEDIWFEWMFHYYTSLINTYYRLIDAKEKDEE